MVEICTVPLLSSIVSTFICFSRTGKTLVMSFCTQFLSTITGLPFIFTAEVLHTCVSRYAAPALLSSFAFRVLFWLLTRDML